MNDKEPTQKQQKEFWEWCGFKEVTVRARAFEIVRGKKHSWETKEQRWLRPNCEFENKLYPSYHGVPFVDWELPPIDLNNLFTYAVPKLKMERDSLITFLWEWVKDMISNDKDPALALFWALWAVMKEVK